MALFYLKLVIPYACLFNLIKSSLEGSLWEYIFVLNLHLYETTIYLEILLILKE